MAKEICTVCGREIDSRGMSGHMKSHVAKQDDGHESGVISYPSHPVKGTHSESEVQSNDQETDVKQDVVPGNTETPNNVKQLKKKKAAKKTVASKPASKPASSPDTRGQRNSGSKSTGHPKDSGVTETEHKEEWKGFFRE